MHLTRFVKVWGAHVCAVQTLSYSLFLCRLGQWLRQPAGSSNPPMICRATAMRLTRGWRMLGDSARFAPIAAKIRADTDATLAGYRIGDRATLRGLHRILLNLALLRGDPTTARREIETIRALQDKQADRLTGGIREAAYLDALTSGAPSTAAFKKRFQEGYAAALDALPWEVVGSDLQEEAGMTSVMTPGYLSGISDTQLQPAVSADQRSIATST